MKRLDIRSPFSKLRKAPFISDLAKRDGFETMDEYRFYRWGKKRCEYYVSEGAEHPNYEAAKNALEWAENNT